MAEVVYLLCTITSLACVALLMRSYRKRRTQLLMWSTLCFVGFAINNLLLFVDLVVVPEVDLSIARSGTALAAVLLLLIGLLWEDS
jgi:hydrogenase/urease accessory protein HupE